MEEGSTKQEASGEQVGNGMEETGLVLGWWVPFKVEYYGLGMD